MSTAPDWFATKFNLADLTIKRFTYWTWSLRPSQPTLGSSVLSLNRPCAAWGETSAEENAELAVVIAAVEHHLKGCFAYDKINYLMLMMLDPHVHFHVIPRYAEPRERFGLAWVDGAWPKPPDLSSGVADASILERVRQEILLS
jgi:diadenosine tetraphosphate (Ap4A) HIT family hydrolase